MKNYYSSNPTFYLGIDCIIFGFNEGEISLLLLKRNFEPAMGEWSLMGGFVQKDESVDDAAKRVLAELTGLENVYMEQVGAFGAIDRDPGERVVSIAYYALININEYDRELVQKHNAYWVNINELPRTDFRPSGDGGQSTGDDETESICRAYRIQSVAEAVHTVPTAKSLRSYLRRTDGQTEFPQACRRNGLYRKDG